MRERVKAKLGQTVIWKNKFGYTYIGLVVGIVPPRKLAKEFTPPGTALYRSARKPDVMIPCESYIVKLYRQERFVHTNTYKVRILETQEELLWAAASRRKIDRYIFCDEFNEPVEPQEDIDEACAEERPSESYSVRE